MDICPVHSTLMVTQKDRQLAGLRYFHMYNVFCQCIFLKCFMSIIYSSCSETLARVILQGSSSTPLQLTTNAITSCKVVLFMYLLVDQVEFVDLLAPKGECNAMMHHYWSAQTFWNCHNYTIARLNHVLHRTLEPNFAQRHYSYNIGAHLRPQNAIFFPIWDVLLH